MANREIETIPVNKGIFMAVLKERKISIRRLAKEVGRNEATIRRYLKRGEMPPYLLRRICDYLDIVYELIG